MVDDTDSWPVAEAVGAAAAIAGRTGEERYREWYGRLWRYADEHLVAPGGNWYERLTADTERVASDDGPAVEPGYHPVGAC